MKKVQEITANLQHVEYLSADIVQVSLVPTQRVPFYSGQYLQLQFDEKAYYFTIANAAFENHHYILQIRLNKDSFLDKHLLALTQEKKSITVRLPLGECHVLQLETTRPIIFLAFGTGFSQAHSMIAHFKAAHQHPEMHLFWCVRSQGDLYLDKKVKQWENSITNFHYAPLLTEQPMESLFPLLLSTVQDLKAMQIVISGAFDTVYAIRSRLLEHGVERRNLFSDAFEFEVKS